ncbi:hypothetical protein YC2023_084839 [Brassica napus]
MRWRLNAGSEIASVRCEAWCIVRLPENTSLQVLKATTPQNKPRLVGCCVDQRTLYLTHAHNELGIISSVYNTSGVSSNNEISLTSPCKRQRELFWFTFMNSPFTGHHANTKHDDDESFSYQRLKLSAMKP